MMMLAQMEGVPGESVKNFLLVGMALLGAGYYGKEIFFKGTKEHTTTKPEGEVYVREEDFQRHVQEIQRVMEELASQIGGVERGANSATEAKVEAVRRELSGLGKDVSALQAAAELQNQQLARMDAKFDRLAERIMRK